MGLTVRRDVASLHSWLLGTCQHRCESSGVSAGGSESAAEPTSNSSKKATTYTCCFFAFWKSAILLSVCTGGPLCFVTHVTMSSLRRTCPCISWPD